MHIAARSIVIFAMAFVVLQTAGVSAVHAQSSLDTRGSIPFPGGSIIPGYDSRVCNGTSVGAIRYNSASSCAEFCNGAAWTCPGGTLYGPTGCATIGALCADGTVFAGWHPITQAHLFIPTTDQEQPGAPGTYTMNWKNAMGTNDISTDSIYDGEVNHANRGGAIGNFQAFQTCENLSFGGQTDWHLPSRVELHYLWSVHETIEAGGNITIFPDATYYWSSTESNNNDAWSLSFFTGQENALAKPVAYRVRCVRR